MAIRGSFDASPRYPNQSLHSAGLQSLGSPISRRTYNSFTRLIALISAGTKADFKATVPLLNLQEASCLEKHLELRHPGHEWIEEVSQRARMQRCRRTPITTRILSPIIGVFGHISDSRFGFHERYAAGRFGLE